MTMFAKPRPMSEHELALLWAAPLHPAAVRQMREGFTRLRRMRRDHEDELKPLARKMLERSAFALYLDAREEGSS